MVEMILTGRNLLKGYISNHVQGHFFVIIPSWKFRKVFFTRLHYGIKFSHYDCLARRPPLFFHGHQHIPRKCTEHRHPLFSLSISE